MKALKTLVMVIVFIILVVCLWVQMAALSAERTVLNSDYYRGLFTETDIPAHLHVVIEAGLTNRLQDDLMADIPVEGFSEAVQQILMGSLMYAFDQAWLERNLLLVTDDILGFVKGEQDKLQAEIDLRENKSRMEQYLAASLEDLFETTFYGMVEVPEGVLQNTGVLVQELDLPDRIMLADLIDEDSAEMQTVLALQTTRSYFRVVPYLFMAVLALFIYLLAGTRVGLKWFGTAFLVAGITFFLGLQLIQRVFATPFAVGLEAKIPFGPEVMVSAFQYTVGRASTIPIIVAVIGLALLVGSTVVKGKLLQEDEAVNNL